MKPADFRKEVSDAYFAKAEIKDHRPKCNRLARVCQLKGNARYKCLVLVGAPGQKHRHRNFATEAEGKEYAAGINTPERLIRVFRPYFATEEKTLAFLALEQQGPPAPPPAPEPVSLTPEPVLTDGAMTHFSVKPYRDKKRPNSRWVVRYKAAGKPAKKFFPTEREAKAFADVRNIEVANHGTEALSMPAELRGMAIRCHNALVPFGKRISDAVDFYVAHLQLTQRSATIENVRTEFLRVWNGRSYCADYIKRLEKETAKMVERFGGKTVVAVITTKELVEFVNEEFEGYAPKTKNNFLQTMSTFFDFARRYGYLKDNPSREIEAFRIIDKPPGVLTPDELDRLLQAAKGSEFLPYLVIGAFAGLRAAEITRLDWSEIDLQDGFIEVTAAKSKTAARRLVKIQPVLAAWLAPYANHRGPVVVQNYKDRMFFERRRLCEIADALVSESERGPGFRLLRKNYPKNALRHSFASYHLAKFNDAAALALEMGHTTTKMIFQHYRRVVRPQQAELYWKVLPIVPANVAAFGEPATVPGCHALPNSAVN